MEASPPVLGPIGVILMWVISPGIPSASLVWIARSGHSLRPAILLPRLSKSRSRWSASRASQLRSLLAPRPRRCRCRCRGPSPFAFPWSSLRPRCQLLNPSPRWCLFGRPLARCRSWGQEQLWASAVSCDGGSGPPGAERPSLKGHFRSVSRGGSLLQPIGSCVGGEAPWWSTTEGLVPYIRWKSVLNRPRHADAMDSPAAAGPRQPAPAPSRTGRHRDLHLPGLRRIQQQLGGIVRAVVLQELVVRRKLRPGRSSPFPGARLSSWWCCNRVAWLSCCWRSQWWGWPSVSSAMGEPIQAAMGREGRGMQPSRCHQPPGEVRASSWLRGEHLAEGSGGVLRAGGGGEPLAERVDQSGPIGGLGLGREERTAGTHVISIAAKVAGKSLACLSPGHTFARRSILCQR
jgi:hypothetical protein